MTIAQVSSGSLPPARPASPEPAGSGEGDFAQLMALQAPAEAAGDGAAAAHGDEARQAKARQSARNLARNPQAEARREAADVDKAAREPGKGDAAEAPTEATDPALAQWLAQWHRPPAEAAAADTDEAKKLAPEAGGVEASGHPKARPALAPAPDAAAPADGRASHGQPGARGAEKAGRERMAALESAAQAPREEASAATASSREASAPAAAGTGFTLPAGFEPVQTAAAPATPTPTAADAGVVGVPLPVPLESPEFAAAFGVEISLLAKDGVQQAELHLNPAEMGPVSVQIALDGERARIDFGAQAAATRAAIEASLPELAAALRDAGLTLAGGGVTQHGGQGADARGEGRREGESRSMRIGRNERADAAAAAQRPAWRGRAGASGVDLYA
ncbi:MAG: flagellar hook-length control protein FliK [Piscinibacter sp.]|uniref:flagellar hook-length control protein FliK n=1 Tax=Piscinibacter sp. TaxID=1903157 RepID=UPI001B779DB9|nr:flagellar hook-length control protein FliK [Piscinibacter sp.]MBP5991059.1 flagellar hook-length control protein FliK [Piscinibacter sp.]MBP6028151.1 flagellar hook-length control protein FliK [Piscinibacter sp.]